MGLETTVRNFLRRKALPYILTLGVTAMSIAPRDAETLPITTVMQIASEMGYLDWIQEPVFTIPDGGDHHSSRFDTDNPFSPDVIVAWRDPSKKSTGEYHIYDRDAGAEQNPLNPLGDYMGRILASANTTAIQTMTITYDTRNGGEYSAGLVTTKQGNGNELLREGPHVYTVIHVSNEGNIEIIGESPPFTLRYDQNIPLPVEPTATPSSTPYPTSTATQTPTHSPTPQPTSTLMPTPLPTDTLVPTPVPSYTPYLQITNTPTSTITPTHTPTNTPPDTATPTRVPTPTAPNYSPTPTATATPEAIVIEGKVDFYLGNNEGNPVPGASVSLIAKNYSLSNANNESAIVQVYVGDDGRYSIQLPKDLAKNYSLARIRVTGPNNHTLVSPPISLEESIYMHDSEEMDNPLPSDFNTRRFRQTFMRRETSLYSEEAYGNQKPPADLPSVIDTTAAENSGYVPDREIVIAREILNNELPLHTRYAMPVNTANVANSHIEDIPPQSLLVYFKDIAPNAPDTTTIAGVGIPDQDELGSYEPRVIDVHLPTIQGLRDRLNLDEPRAIALFTKIARQELSGRVGAFGGQPPDEDNLNNPSIFLNDIEKAPSQYTSEDIKMIYFNMNRGELGTPRKVNNSLIDLSITPAVYQPLRK